MTLSGQTVVLEVVTSLHLKIINPYPNHSVNRCGGEKKAKCMIANFLKYSCFLTLWFGQRVMEPGGELGYQPLELIPGSLGPGAAQLLTNLSVLIQTNPITSSGPDQSHYHPGSDAVALRDLTPVSEHHTHRCCSV